MSEIRAKVINQLRDALQNEPHQHIKTAACYDLGHIGRYGEQHALEVLNVNFFIYIILLYGSKF